MNVEVLLWLLRVDIYMLTVLLVCCLTAGYGSKTRGLVGLRLAVSALAWMLWACACNQAAIMLHIPVWNAGGVAVLKYLGIYLLTIGAFRFCTRYGWNAALYGATTGYILQHCAIRIAEILQVVFPSDSLWVNTVLIAAITALVCLCFTLAFRRRYDILEYDHYGGEIDILLVTAAAVVSVIIVLEPLIRREFGLGGEQEAVNSRLVMSYINIISVLLSLLALVISMCQMRQAESRKKSQITEQLLYAERSRYALEKETIEAINIRCHDIRHQIAALSGTAHREELQELEQLVDIYDCGLKTQCAALDLVLSSKALVCSGKQIRLTCVADGQRLSFMEDVDIYALFGNILDNAIEAVERLEDPEKRLISLDVRARDHFLFISQENYFAGSLMMEQGLPVTMKEDKRFHGFGMQSIRMLTEKYGGDLQIRADGGLYRLSVMLPVTERENGKE